MMEGNLDLGAGAVAHFVDGAVLFPRGDLLGNLGERGPLLPTPLGKYLLPLVGEREIVMKQTEAFRILASADRQLILHELVENGGETTVEDLSRRVAARRHRITPTKISDQRVKRAQVRLVHTHFPKLADWDIIEWHDTEISLSDDKSVEQLFEAAEILESWPPDDLLEPHMIHAR